MYARGINRWRPYDFRSLIVRFLTHPPARAFLGCFGAFPHSLARSLTRAHNNTQQDHWWLSGLHRDVELQSVPKNRVLDYFARPTPKDSGLTDWDLVCARKPSCVWVRVCVREHLRS